MSCSNLQIKSPTWTSRVRLEEKNLKVPQLFPPLSSQGISVWMYCTCHFCYLTENFSGGMAGWRILCVTLYLRSLKYLVFSFPTATHFSGQIWELVFLCRGQGGANPLLLVLCGSDKVISVLLRMECSSGFPVFKKETLIKHHIIDRVSKTHFQSSMLLLTVELLPGVRLCPALCDVKQWSSDCTSPGPFLMWMQRQNRHPLVQYYLWGTEGYATSQSSP